MLQLLDASFFLNKAYKNLDLKNQPILPGLEKYTQDQLFFISFGLTWCELYKPEAKREMLLENTHTVEDFRYIKKHILVD